VLALSAINDIPFGEDRRLAMFERLAAPEAWGDRVLIGSRAVPSLAPGARSSGVATVTVPMGTPNGTYRLLTCPDDTDAVTEINEANNCRASAETVRIR